MMAKALAGIMPPLSRDEALEVTRIFSSVGLVPRGQGLMTKRPVRSPHHTASSAAMIGGGTIPRPGEVSLAHHGVLFLDEMPELPRQVLETLRQPMEDGYVTIARAIARCASQHGSCWWPPSIRPRKAICHGCSGPPRHGSLPFSLERPIDRPHRHPRGSACGAPSAVDGSAKGTNSETMRQQVIKARQVQTARNGGPTRPNSTLSGRELDKHAVMSEPTREVLRQAMSELGLSARAYDKVRRVARTIADLDQKESVELHHVAEAVQYRLLDRKK